MVVNRGKKKGKRKYRNRKGWMGWKQADEMQINRKRVKEMKGKLWNENYGMKIMGGKCGKKKRHNQGTQIRMERKK